MTKLPRLLALLALSAIVAGACTRPFQSTAPAKMMDVYAASPSQSEAASLLGGDWWPSAPTFLVRPLDDANFATQVQYSVIRRYANVGTSEVWIIRYIQFDKASSATSVLSNVESSAGSGDTGKNVADKTLYYHLKVSQGGAPYETETWIRVNSLVIVSAWFKKDGFPGSDQLGRIAAKLASGEKDAAAGKMRGATLSADDLASLPPPNAYITLLGAVRLPIEAIPLMLNSSAPTELATMFKSQQQNDFLYGDYVLDQDTHMEVQVAVFTLTSAKAASDLFDAFRGTATADSNGVVKTYNDVTGPGQYDFLILSGKHIGLLICRSLAESSAHEAASRACETPLETVATAWPSAFTD